MDKNKIGEKVRKILRDLDNINVDIRKKAASNLKDIKYDLLKYVDLSLLKDVVTKLIEKLDDQSGKVRYYIACTLESISSKFPELFKDKISKLIEKLDESYMETYKRFSEYENEKSHSILVFNDRDWREEARGHIADVLENVVKKFPELFKNKMPKLIEKLDDNNPYVRISMIHIIEEVGKKYPELIMDAVPKLLEMIGVPDSESLAATLTLLKVAEKHVDEIKDKVDDLVKALELINDRGEDGEYISGCITDMLHIIWKKYPSLVKKAMERLWRDVDEDKAAAICIVAYEHPELIFDKIPKLKDLLNNPNVEVRAYAVTALGNISTKYPQLIEDTIPKLKEALNDPDELIREHAATTLVDIGIKHPQLIEDTIPRLVELLIDENPDVCEVTYNVLQDLIEKQPKTIEKIIPKLKEITFKVITETSTFEEYYLENLIRLIKQTIIKKNPKATKNLVSKLTEKLNHPSEEVRKRVIWTLGEIGEEEPEIVNKCHTKADGKTKQPF